MNKISLAIISLAITPSLFSCNSSDQVSSEEVVLNLTAAVIDKSVSLRASLRQRLSDSIVVSLVLDEDRLYIENKDSSETINLEKVDSEFTYSGSISQDIGDNVELVFDRTRTSNGILSSKINIPFFYLDLKASPESILQSNNNLVSIDWVVDLLDGVTAPNVAWLNSNVISCVDSSGLQMDITNVRKESPLATLDMQSILEQTLELPSDQIAYLSNENVQGQIQYCDYGISLTSSWSVNWNGSEPPTGADGPVWISPDANYGNGKVPGDEPAFGITVNANPASIRVTY